MARRKTAFLSDGSDSDGSGSQASGSSFNSQEDGDSRAERRLFELNGNKRRRTGGQTGKERAWEGIFGNDEDVGGHTVGQGSNPRPGRSRPKVTKAPTFISGAGPSSSTQPSPPLPDPDIKREDEGSSDDTESETDSNTAARSPRVYDENDYDDTPAPRAGLGGIGFKTPKTVVDNDERETTQSVEAEGQANEARPRAGIGARAGIGSNSRAGIGSKPGNISTDAESRSPEDASTSTRGVPDIFGRRAAAGEESELDRSRSAFRGRAIPSSTPTPTSLTADEAAHFRTIAGNIGFKLLQKSGWTAGEGLGKDRSGRAVPVAAGKIMRGQGISSGIRTEDSKREARRRGEVVSDDEGSKPARRGRGGHRAHTEKENKEQQDHSWRKQRKVKIKVEHKSYEQILAEAGDGHGAGLGQILDARGGELREVSSLSALSLSGWTPTADSAQLPELRHNLRLIVDVAKADVGSLAREGKSVDERRKWAAREEQMTRNRIDNLDHGLSRLERIQSHVSGIATLTASLSGSDTSSLDPFKKHFEALLHEFKDEYAEYNLDDVVVGAISQILRPTFAQWQPFDVTSDILLSTLKQWRSALKLRPTEDDSQRSEVSVHRTGGADTDLLAMTAWESLIWSTWLPKVRSAINNEWSPSSPQAAVHLIESWECLLPDFVRDNILDQLVLPKIRQAIEVWDGRHSRTGKNRPLAGIIFPWLPLLGPRLEDIMESAKRRIRYVLRKWTAREGVLDELIRWRKDIFSSKEWDELMLRNVVPKLGACLRDDFTINPRKQDMTPLENWILPWYPLLRASTFAQLFEVHFFPEWLNTLYIWLIQPNYDSDEVATWFKWWKDRFPQTVREMPTIAYGFNIALELMQEAMRLGPSAASHLRKPIYEPPKSVRQSVKIPTATKPRPTETATVDITFRSLAEDVATQNDLIFLPLGRSHVRTGKPLFKVCKNVDGKGGVTVYIEDDAVFAQEEDGAFKAVSLDDMVKRALSN